MKAVQKFPEDAACMYHSNQNPLAVCQLMVSPLCDTWGTFWEIRISISAKIPPKVI